MSITIKNKIEDLKYQFFLQNNSGNTATNLYNDLKIMIEDYDPNMNITKSMVDSMAKQYNQPDFVVEVLFDKAKNYVKNKL